MYHRCRMLFWLHTVPVSEVYVASLQHDNSWQRVASSKDNTTSATEPTVTLRRGRASGVACVAVADGACDGASLRSLQPIVQHVATERRFVRTVETVLKSPSDNDDDLPTCRTTTVSWYWTTSAPASLNGGTLTCVTGNQLSASARLLVECKTVIFSFLTRIHAALSSRWLSRPSRRAMTQLCRTVIFKAIEWSPFFMHSLKCPASSSDFV